MSNNNPSSRSWWVGGWLAALLAIGGTLLWCLVIYFLLADKPRDWQYGTTPYVPGESRFSIEARPRGAVPPQVTLPEKDPGGADAKR